MKQTEIMLFFDTEDYICENAAEAIFQEAEICRTEGIRGNFSVVGLLCDSLKEWGRQDVIEALGHHVIGTHTLGHTMHPAPLEQSDFYDFDYAYRTLARYEDKGLEKLHETFGKDRKIMFACPPGNSKTYVGGYYYADRGIPFLCDTVVYTEKQKPLSYCNQEHIAYSRCIDGLSEGRISIPDILDEIAGYDIAVLYTHPNMAVKKEFCDTLDFHHVNIHTKGNYVLPPDRPQEETERFYKGMRDMIRTIKADPRFRFTDLDEIAAKRTARPAITPTDIPMIRETLKKDFAPVGEWSVSDIFLASAAFLSGSTAYVPGKVYGFLTAPYAAEKPFYASKAEILDTVADLDLSRFLPDKVLIGEHYAGPADLLFAMLDILCGAENVEIIPKEQLVSVDPLGELKDFRPAGTWHHSLEFTDRYVSDRLRLQCWTLSYPKAD